MEKRTEGNKYTSVLGFAVCLFIVLSQSSLFVFNRLQTGTDEIVCYLAAIALQALSALLPFIIIVSRYGSGTGFRMPGKEESVLILPLFLSLYFAYYISSLACSTILGHSDTGLPFVPAASSDPILFVLCFVFYVVAPAVLEELLFRRAIIPVIMPYGKWFAVVIGSLLFAMSHWDRTRVIPVFIFSFFLAVIYIETDNLTVPSVIHLLNNTFAFAGSYYGSGYDQDTSSSFMMTVAVIGFVCFIILGVTLPIGRIFAPDNSVTSEKKDFWSFPVVMAFLGYVMLLALR